MDKIKVNSKHFFKYANGYKRVPSTPNILQDSQGQLILDKKVIADLLQRQFESVFSKIEDTENIYTFDSNPNIIFPLTDLHITEWDIIRSIDKIKVSSSCPKDEIPARVLKECKATLCKPLRLLWSSSFASGHIPKQYKNQIIIPIFKKGSKTKAANYRPIALTAHSIKIFERIIRDKLVEYFEQNYIINGQNNLCQQLG